MARQTVEDVNCIRICKVKRGAETVRINTKNLGVVAANIVYTSQALGGKRAWFECPKCQGRCTALYVGASLACRRCLGLGYNSQYVESAERFGHYARWLYGQINVDHSRWPRCLGEKPKGMRWTTYYDMLAKALDYDTRANPSGQPSVAV